jgi:tetratricopeptide (TPR) repeat protein
MTGCRKEAITSNSFITRRQLLQKGVIAGFWATISAANNSKAPLVNEAKKKLTDILDEEAKVVEVKPENYALLTSFADVIYDIKIKTRYGKKEIINILDWIDSYILRAGIRPSGDNQNLITNALQTKKVDCDTSLLNIHTPIISTLGIDARIVDILSQGHSNGHTFLRLRSSDGDEFNWNFSQRCLSDQYYMDLYALSSDAFKAILSISKSPNRTHSRRLSNIGNYLASTERKKEALQFYQRALHLDKNNVCGYTGTAALYPKLCTIEQAIAALSEVIRLLKGQNLQYHERGNLLYEKGSLKQAFNDFEKCIHLNNQAIQIYESHADRLEKKGMHLRHDLKALSCIYLNVLAIQLTNSQCYQKQYKITKDISYLSMEEKENQSMQVTEGKVNRIIDKMKVMAEHSYKK